MNRLSGTRSLAVAFGLCAVGLCRPAEAVSITVPSNAPLGVATGVFLSPGQQVYISAAGYVDIAATDGNYGVDPNGTLITPPALFSNAYVHFLNNSVSPILLPGYANLPTGGTLANAAPWGALIGGFSTVATPTSLSDFFGGSFFMVGALATLSAPNAPGYQLFLAVNDCGCFNDNFGSFTANVVPEVLPEVPEPASLVLLGTGLLGLARARRRR